MSDYDPVDSLMQTAAGLVDDGWDIAQAAEWLQSALSQYVEPLAARDITNEFFFLRESKKKEGMSYPPELPPEQTTMLKTPGLNEYYDALQNYVRQPAPGTTMWRGEQLPYHPTEAQSVGMHWTANPDAILYNYGPEEGHQNVIWQGRMNPEQMIPRSHPIWNGRNRSLGWEGELRFAPQTPLDVEGAYIWTGSEHPSGGNGFAPTNPKHHNPNWEYIPINKQMPVEHKGFSPYEKEFPDLFKQGAIWKESSSLSGTHGTDDRFLYKDILQNGYTHKNQPKGVWGYTDEGTAMGKFYGKFQIPTNFMLNNPLTGKRSDIEAIILRLKQQYTTDDRSQALISGGYDGFITNFGKVFCVSPEQASLKLRQANIWAQKQTKKDPKPDELEYYEIKKEKPQFASGEWTFVGDPKEASAPHGTHDPLVCPGCGSSLSEPHMMSNGQWVNNCPNCRGTYKIPSNSPLLMQWQQQEALQPYPDILKQVGKPALWGELYSSEMEPSMRLQYLPTNMAWVVMFGDQITPIDQIPGMGTKRFFQSQEEAIEGLRRVGLGVDPQGNISSLPQETAEHPDPWADNEPGTTTFPEHWGWGGTTSSSWVESKNVDEEVHDKPENAFPSSSLGQYLKGVDKDIKHEPIPKKSYREIFAQVLLENYQATQK